MSTTAELTPASMSEIEGRKAIVLIASGVDTFEDYQRFVEAHQQRPRLGAERAA